MRTKILAIVTGALLTALMSSCSEPAISEKASAEGTPTAETISETAIETTAAEETEQITTTDETEAVGADTQTGKAEVRIVNILNCSEKTVTQIVTVTENGEEIVDGKTVQSGETIEMQVPVGVSYTSTFSFDNGDAFEIKDMAPEEMDGKNLYITNGAYVIADELTDTEETAGAPAEQPPEMPAETEYDPNDGCIGDEGLFW